MTAIANFPVLVSLPYQYPQKLAMRPFGISPTIAAFGKVTILAPEFEGGDFFR
jgi:hypothetical protein